MEQLELFDKPESYYVIFPFAGFYKQCYGPYVEEEAIKFMKEDEDKSYLCKVVYVKEAVDNAIY